MTRYFFLFLLLISGVNSQAQNIIINEDPEIRRIIDQYAATNRMYPMTEGWRIQLIAATDRNQMEQVKQKFMRDFPSIPVDWIHASPYYKLRAGAFQTKLDASKILHKIKKRHPSAYLVKDNMHRSEWLPIY